MSSLSVAETKQSSSRTYLFLVVAVATVGGFLFGFDMMIFVGAELFLEEHFSLTKLQLGQAGASVVIGALVGTLLAAVISDAIGRKKAMFIAGLLFLVSAIGTALPATIGQFNFFRTLAGLGIGVAMVISPIYLAEIAPRRIRGSLVTFNQIVIVMGSIVAMLVGFVLAKYMHDTSMNWRWMFASAVVPTAVLLIGILFIPESPRYLLQNNRTDEALNILSNIDGEQEARRELREIQQSLEIEKEQAAVSYRELFHPGVRKAMVIAMGLAALQQFSGGQPLTMYAPMIFEKAGFPVAHQAIGVTAFMQSINLCVIVLVLFLVEKVGRRPLLITGLSLMTLGHLVLAYCFSAGLEGVPVAVILTATTCMSNLSISPLAWVIMAEIFPNRIRGRAMGVATFVLYLCMYVMSLIFPPMKEFFETRLGSPAGIFVLFAIVTFFGTAFIYFFVPETKGKSLEDIANNWLKSSPAHG
jgi:SP family arabinose:H+ symporter-like MFS transporter